MLAAWLAGCAVGPNFVRPAPPAVDRYSERSDPTSTRLAEGESQRLERGAQVVGNWWTLFDSPQVDALMEQAVAENQSLKAALASLRASQANLRAGYGVFFPQADANASVERQKTTLARLGQPNVPPTIFNLFTLSATIGYALDVFGGQRRAVESLQAQVDFQTYTAVATYLTLTANVLNTVIARAAYAEEARATEDIVRDLREQVAITEAQARAGTVPYTGVLSLRSQLAAVEASLPPLLQRVSQADHLLTTLAGHLPAEWTAPAVDFTELKLPDTVPVSLPSELVRQRPDILAAEAQLHQASAEVGVATAALFPSLTLSASLGGNNTTLDSMFASNGTFWSVAAGLTAPIFRGGTLRARRRAAVETYDGALASYRQTVLAAFTQVADTLQALEHDADTLEAEGRATDAASEALRLVRANSQAGIASDLQVLVAFVQYHQARIGEIQARAQRLQDTAALLIALGGGWWDPEKSLLCSGANPGPNAGSSTSASPTRRTTPD